MQSRIPGGSLRWQRRAGGADERIRVDVASPYEFNHQELNCVVGGLSALDIPRLNISNAAEARQFVLAYGYNLDDPEHRETLWAMQRRAVALIKEQLLDEGEVIPEDLYDPTRLTDLTQLLTMASSREPQNKEIQKWACAILRVMHVYVHLRNDLFSAFRNEIQAQVIKPFTDVILNDELIGTTVLGPSAADGGIKLYKFEIKPFKTTASSVIKLLARPEKVALALLDKLGVRFVTRTVFDSFRLIRFLIDHHIVSYPHIIPDQSTNTLYPTNLFLEIMDEISQREAVQPRGPTTGPELSAEDLQLLLKERLESELSRAEYREKPNSFSGPEYRFIKFINRKLVSVPLRVGEKETAFRFFHPYEIQIMDYDTYIRNLSGPMAHDEYKNRQRRKARERVMGST